MVVLNMRKPEQDRPDAIRVDRLTKWGNPFPITAQRNRAQAVEQYRFWLWSRIRSGKVSLEELAELDGHDLKCWCAPALCHADVLAKAASWAAAELAEKEGRLF